MHLTFKQIAGIDKTEYEVRSKLRGSLS